MQRDMEQQWHLSSLLHIADKMKLYDESRIGSQVVDISNLWMKKSFSLFSIHEDFLLQILSFEQDEISDIQGIFSINQLILNTFLLRHFGQILINET